MATPTSVRLGEPTRRRIKALAAAADRSEAVITRRALELGLRQLERQHRRQSSPAEKD